MDLVIKNADIIDGTGNKAYKGSIALEDNNLDSIGGLLIFLSVGLFLFINRQLILSR